MSESSIMMFLSKQRQSTRELLDRQLQLKWNAILQHILYRNNLGFDFVEWSFKNDSVDDRYMIRGVRELVGDNGMYSEQRDGDRVSWVTIKWVCVEVKNE